MTEHADVANVDWEDLYRGGSAYPEGNPLRAVVQGLVPWDIGGPQQALVELESAGGVRGRVLDAGCGLGDGAVFLAGRGYPVTAFDKSPTAIRGARARAEALGLSVEFLVADATTLDDLAGRTFDTIVDSALYHCLPPGQRPAYLTALHWVSAPGARLHIFCFSDATLPEIRSPMWFSADDVRTNLAESGWATVRFERVEFALNAAVTHDTMREVVTAASADRDRQLVDELETDEHGRLLLPAWSIGAVRAEDES